LYQKARTAMVKAGLNITTYVEMILA